LRNFDPQRGSLTTILLLQALSEHRQQKSSRAGRQQSREVPLDHHDMVDPGSGVQLELLVEDVLRSMTATEKNLLGECLAKPAQTVTPRPLSPAKRQALSRLMKKLRALAAEKR
jgi:hypothetical protein